MSQLFGTESWSWRHVDSKMAPLREPLGQPAKTGTLAIASKTRRRRDSLYFQSTLGFPSLDVAGSGHFAAWEQPELFASEVRAAFRSLR
jgi:pimeloyl-ACP methyl ester carboxylesterase